MILTKTAYARARGVDPSTIAQWIKRGKLSAPAITANGRVLVEEADRQLRATLDFAKSTAKGGPASRLLEDHSASSNAAIGVDVVLEPLRSPMEDAAALKARRERLLLDEMERKAALARGELMRVDKAVQAWSAELADLLGAIEQFVVVDLPEKLGLDRDAVIAARREWRAFRERQAGRAASPAAGAAADGDDAGVAR